MILRTSEMPGKIGYQEFEIKIISSFYPSLQKLMRRSIERVMIDKSRSVTLLLLDSVQLTHQSPLLLKFIGRWEEKYICNFGHVLFQNQINVLEINYLLLMTVKLVIYRNNPP